MIEKKRGARGFWGGMLGIASVAFVTTAVAACSSTPTGVLADAATDTSKPTADAGHDVAHSCSVGKAACGGACVDTATDVDNCGACGHTCAPGDVCSTGNCSPYCGGGTSLCSGSCTNVQTDPANCGKCGNVCPSGMPFCSLGGCSLTCAGGTTACGSSCVDELVDPANCGACAKVCKTGELCSNGVCGVTCTTGLTLCSGTTSADGGTSDAAVADGGTTGLCVDTSTDRLNCGGCGKACASGQVCSDGTCVVSCPGTEINCGGSCIDPKTSNSNCGASGNCSGANAGTACTGGDVCSGGMCGVSCPTPEINCGGTCINPQTSNSNCGASGNCTGGSAGVACTGDTVCGAGVCAPDCPATFTNCSGTCVDEQNDPKHCGGCGPCAAVANDATPVCVTGGCGTGTCEPGFADCNLLYSDGCERDLLTDPANCGACGHVCPGGGSAGCSAGNCTLPCTTTVTSLLNVTSTYASAISVTYAMIGGGGGAGGASTGGAAGGGGGSSAILNAGALVSFASGGNGGADSLATLDPGTNGTAVSGTFVLAPGANLTAYVGGGGGAGGYDWGGGGGSGYFGGAGGEDYSTFVAGGAGGSNVGGVGIGEAGNGTSLAGGNGNPQNGEGGLGGTAGTGGAGGLTAGGD